MNGKEYIQEYICLICNHAIYSSHTKNDDDVCQDASSVTNNNVHYKEHKALSGGTLRHVVKNEKLLLRTFYVIKAPGFIFDDIHDFQLLVSTFNALIVLENLFIH